MADPLNVAVVGLVHDHIWGTLDHLREDGRAVLVAAADDNVCGSENNRHAELVEAAAARGLHIMVEKPMAATYAQARRMLAAAARGNIMLMINWPTAWNRSIVLSLALVQEGRIGQ